MTDKTITAQNVDNQIKALYETAFPVEEQVPWKDLLRLIGEMPLDFTAYYDEDKQYIDSILSAGKYAISHSQDYRDAYHPHYRIVSREIFDKEVSTLIDKKR